MSGRLAIVRAAHLRDYLVVMRRIGMPVDRELARSRLPPQIEEAPDLYVSVPVAIEWIAQCGRDLEPMELGFLGAQQASRASIKPAYLTEMLAARIEANALQYPRSPWLFPSLWSASGHLTQVNSRYLPSPHVHRHSYATGAKASGLDEYDIKLLLNHKITDVTGRYLHASMLGNHLKASQERVTAWLLSQMKPAPVAAGGAE